MAAARQLVTSHGHPCGPGYKISWLAPSPKQSPWWRREDSGITSSSFSLHPTPSSPTANIPSFLMLASWSWRNLRRTPYTSTGLYGPSIFPTGCPLGWGPFLLEKAPLGSLNTLMIPLFQWRNTMAYEGAWTLLFVLFWTTHNPGPWGTWNLAGKLKGQYFKIGYTEPVNWAKWEGWRGRASVPCRGRHQVWGSGQRSLHRETGCLYRILQTGSRRPWFSFLPFPHSSALVVLWDD